jgi:hypothetical protein
MSHDRVQFGQSRLRLDHRIGPCGRAAHAQHGPPGKFVTRQTANNYLRPFGRNFWPLAKKSAAAAANRFQFADWIWDPRQTRAIRHREVSRARLGKGLLDRVRKIANAAFGRRKHCPQSRAGSPLALHRVSGMRPVTSFTVPLGDCLNRCF